MCMILELLRNGGNCQQPDDLRMEADDGVQSSKLSECREESQSIQSPEHWVIAANIMISVACRGWIFLPYPHLESLGLEKRLVTFLWVLHLSQSPTSVALEKHCVSSITKGRGRLIYLKGL